MGLGTRKRYCSWIDDESEYEEDADRNEEGVDEEPDCSFHVSMLEDPMDLIIDVQTGTRST